jgi:uncharacterized protein YehS (DUF1456 family)
MMTNNDMLRTLRYALNMSDAAMMDIFNLSGHALEPFDLAGLLKKEEESGYCVCTDAVLGWFLDGLITRNRGKREIAPDQVKGQAAPLNNNAILKKLRIALELDEENMLGIMKLANINVSRSELTALFRKKEHKNYKECGDQFLRSFLKGLAVRYRAR